MFKLKKLFLLFLCFFIYSPSVFSEDAYFKVSYGISTFDMSTSVKAGTPTFDDEDSDQLLTNPWVSLAHQAQTTLEEDILYLNRVSI